MTKEGFTEISDLKMGDRILVEGDKCNYDEYKRSFYVLSLEKGFDGRDYAILGRRKYHKSGHRRVALNGAPYTMRISGMVGKGRTTARDCYIKVIGAGGQQEVFNMKTLKYDVVGA